MSDNVKAIWDRFDELAGKAEDENTRLIIEAIRAQSELLNLKLNMLPHEAAALLQKVLPKK